MKARALQLLRVFGVNRAIGYGVLGRMWSALAGPLTILLIATRFSKVEQGFYYTFSSILALQVFFELGLLTVLAQFAAHEFAFLSWGKQGEVTGNEFHRDRFLDLLGKGVKWYSISAVLLMVALIPAGILFFSQRAAEASAFSWKLPWALAVVGVGCNLLLIPFYAVITGSGDVASINRREMLGGMTGSILGWLIIACGGGLYAISAVTSGTILVGVLYLYKSKPRLVQTAYSHAFGSFVPQNRIAWWGEVWPMQWKIALSWVSGYFIFQLFTPVLFKFHGPVVAGQMGMTLTLANGLLGISLTWLHSRLPEFGKLIAVSKWEELNKHFKRAMIQCLSVSLAIFTVAIISIYFLQKYTTIGIRFLTIWQVFILLLTASSNIVVNGLASYMRAHKQEPMLTISVVNAVLISTSTLVFGVLYSSAGIVISNFLITLSYALPSTFLLWKKFRINYHCYHL